MREFADLGLVVLKTAEKLNTLDKSLKYPDKISNSINGRIQKITLLHNISSVECFFNTVG